MSRRGFICAGCWTVDRIKCVDRWPAEEELARIVQVERRGGGSAHNVAIDMRKLDPSMPVATIAMLGNDDDGDFLRQRAQAHQVDAAQLHGTDQRATAYTDVMTVESTGKRTFFYYPGSNDLLTPAHFALSGRSEKILHLGLLSLHAALDASDAKGGNGWSSILQAAQASGFKTSIEMVSIDPIRNHELVKPCLPFIDYLVVNDHEMGAIAQQPTLKNGATDVQQCLEAAKSVLAQGSMQVVVVHYPAGAICVSRGGDVLVTESLKVPQTLIKSAVGAGDAFVSGMLYALHEHWQLPAAMELAHSAAAASLRSLTTTGSVESVNSCLQFAQDISA